MLIYSAETDRKCGGCTLCCKLVGVQELNKPAGMRCPHQRFGKGCMIYARKPASCTHYSCRWLLGVDTHDLPRPDRVHYVLDPVPDYVTMRTATGELFAHVEVVQVWCDPGYPDAHHDPALRRYLLRRGDEGIAGLIRYSGEDAFALFPPQMTKERAWREQRGKSGPEHSVTDFFAAKAENDALAKRKEEQHEG